MPRWASARSPKRWEDDDEFEGHRDDAGRLVTRLLLEGYISTVPVIEPGGRPVGMVSEGDFVRSAENGYHRRGSWWLRLMSDSGASAAEYVTTHGRTAADVIETVKLNGVDAKAWLAGATQTAVRREPTFSEVRATIYRLPSARRSRRI